MVTIGLLGAGFMAETHVEAYRGIADATVAAVVAPNSATAFVEEQGLDATPHASLATMLDEDDVDAVDICTPTPTHARLAETALERGLPTLCEKPIAGTLTDARAMRAAAEDAGVPLMVGHVLRFFPQYERARETVRRGEVGTPAVVRARRLSPFPAWGADGWYAEGSGGPLVDLVIHDFDFLRWTVGDVEQVFARSTGGDRPHVQATLRFENGAVGSVEGSWARPEGSELHSEFELAGEAGLVEFTESEPLVRETAGGRTVESPLAADGYERQLRAFVECVGKGTDPPVTATDAIAALRLSLAARQSAERGEPVAPSEVAP